MVPVEIMYKVNQLFSSIEGAWVGGGGAKLKFISQQEIGKRILG